MEVAIVNNFSQEEQFHSNLFPDVFELRFEVVVGVSGSNVEHFIALFDLVVFLGVFCQVLCSQVGDQIFNTCCRRYVTLVLS